MIRIILIVLEILIGLSALAGGIFALSGARGVSREWLNTSPFSTYFVPGLVLFVVVGGSMLTSAALLLADSSAARPVSAAAGVLLVGWIVALMSVIGHRTWLEDAFAALGLAVVVLSLFLPSPG